MTGSARLLDLLVPEPWWGQTILAAPPVSLAAATVPADLLTCVAETPGPDADSAARLFVAQARTLLETSRSAAGPDAAGIALRIDLGPHRLRLQIGPATLAALRPFLARPPEAWRLVETELLPDLARLVSACTPTELELFCAWLWRGGLVTADMLRAVLPALPDHGRTIHAALPGAARRALAEERERRPPPDRGWMEEAGWLTAANLRLAFRELPMPAGLGALAAVRRRLELVRAAVFLERRPLAGWVETCAGNGTLHRALTGGSDMDWGAGLSGLPEAAVGLVFAAVSRRHAARLETERALAARSSRADRVLGTYRAALAARLACWELDAAAFPGLADALAANREPCLPALLLEDAGVGETVLALRTLPAPARRRFLDALPAVPARTLSGLLSGRLCVAAAAGETAQAAAALTMRRRLYLLVQELGGEDGNAGATA